MTQQQLSTMKAEFDQAFRHIREDVPSSTTTLVPQNLFDPAIKMKRMGLYTESSRGYIQIVNIVNAFTPNVAAAWVKVLACGGDLDDALMLCMYTIVQFTPNADAAGIHFQMLVMRYYTYLSFLHNNDIRGLKQKLAEDSGNPSYSISDSEIDLLNEPDRMAYWKDIAKDLCK